MATYDMPASSRTGEAGGTSGTSGVAPRDKSLGDLFADLTRDTAKLVRQEVELARIEVTQKAVKAGKDVAMIAAGGLVAYAGLVVLMVGIGFALAKVMEHWLAFGIVGLVVAIVGGVTAMSGLNALKNVDPLPRQTMESLKEDAQALKG